MYKTSLIQCIWRLILLSVFFFPTFAVSQFAVTPESQSVLEGTSIVFRCRADGNNDDLSYSWHFNGSPLTLTERVYQNGSNLHILNVNKTVDVGIYVCVAHSKSSGAREAATAARLEVIWLNQPVVHLINVDKHSNSYVLKCHVEGHGDIAISWFRDEELLERTPHIDWQRRRLFIKHATPAENGIYACGATNKAGSIVSTKNYRLKLRDVKRKKASLDYFHRYHKLHSNCEPGNHRLCRGKRGDDMKVAQNIEFIDQPNDVTVNEPQPVRLECSFRTTTGTQNQMTIKWRKDGLLYRQLNLSAPSFDQIFKSEPSRVTIDKDKGSLVFRSTQASDEGVYDCAVLNNDDGSGISSKPAKLEIVPSLKFLSIPTRKTLVLNMTTKVHCKVQGIAPLIITWAKEGSDGGLPNGVTVENGTLIFERAEFIHKGNYTCTATNSQGSISSTVSINVAVAPQFDIKPTDILQVQEMGVAFLHCQASGVPTPTVQWDKDLKSLHINESDDERFEVLENGTLIIRDVHLEDEAKYGCTIGNSAGLKREETSLSVKPSFLPIDGTEEDGFVITKAVLITMSVAATYIILVIFLMIWCRKRRQSRKLRLNETLKDNGDFEGELKMAETEPCLPVEKPKEQNGSVKKLNGKAKMNGDKSDDTNNSKGSKKSTASVLDAYQISRAALTDLIPIGKGEFGEVLIGKIKKSDLKKEENGPVNETINETEKKPSKEALNEIKEDAEYRLIMVKALNKAKDEYTCTEYRRQIDLFRAVTSRSVARLYGLCREKDPNYIVLEYTDWGDLKQFLLATSNKVNTAKLDSKPPPLIVPQILTLAHQIGRGMDAIFKARLIHKDLATRNILITSRFTAKISLPGLSKDKYSKEYFKHRNQLLPLRWLAPECLSDDDYSIKSDVFAYGVLVWEIFTQAVKLPFEELPNEQYLQQAQAGKLDWKVADETPEQLKNILLSCWSANPKERPSFSQLVTALGSCLQSEYPKSPEETK